LNTSFNIRSTGIDTATSHLFIEAGPAGISWCILDKDKYFNAVVVYTLPANADSAEIARSLDDMIRNEHLLQQSFGKTDIIWTFPASILVPPAQMEPAANSEILDLVHGDLQAGETRSEFLYRQNLHNVYRVPSEVNACITRYFPLAAQTHQYSLLPELTGNPGSQLLAIFYSNSVTAVLRKEGHLQLIRNFPFHIPDDAAWFLLNICEVFELQPDEVELHLAGMIDGDSSLYGGLYKYFLNIRFRDLPENVLYADIIREQPPHYFSHLFAQAACV
jgi:hypothetical protein